MNFNNNNILSKALLILNPRLPVSNTHYVTGCGLNMFTSMMSVENNLTCFTSKLGGLFNKMCCNNSKKCKY